MTKTDRYRCKTTVPLVPATTMRSTVRKHAIIAARMDREIDRYVALRELGRGAFGAVYLARHKILGTHVALKVLHGLQAHDPSAIDRFLREARAAASIGSPHIVRVSDAGISSEQEAFLAMELLEGEDLAAYL